MPRIKNKNPKRVDSESHRGGPYFLKLKRKRRHDKEYQDEDPLKSYKRAYKEYKQQEPPTRPEDDDDDDDGPATPTKKPDTAAPPSYPVDEDDPMHDDPVQDDDHAVPTTKPETAAPPSYPTVDDDSIWEPIATPTNKPGTAPPPSYPNAPTQDNNDDDDYPVIEDPVMHDDRDPDRVKEGPTNAAYAGSIAEYLLVSGLMAGASLYTGNEQNKLAQTPGEPNELTRLLDKEKGPLSKTNVNYGNAYAAEEERYRNSLKGKPILKDIKEQMIKDHMQKYEEVNLPKKEAAAKQNAEENLKKWKANQASNNPRPENGYEPIPDADPEEYDFKTHEQKVDQLTKDFIDGKLTAKEYRDKTLKSK